MAKILTDAELRIFAGWTKSSPMAGVYTHLNSNDVNNKILEKRGMIKEEVKKENKLLEPIKCSRCQNLNPIENTICEFCNQILDPKTAFNFDNNLLEENKKLNERLNIVEECLKQMAQDNNSIPKINEKAATISVSGVQWDKQFIEFQQNSREKKKKVF